MNGNKAVLDSNVIIDVSKGYYSFELIAEKYDFLFISIITYIEVLGYNFHNEMERNIIIDILENISIFEVNKRIADFAIEFRKKKKIKTPDAIILATAKISNSCLITGNISDFQNIDPNINIFPVEFKNE